MAESPAFALAGPDTLSARPFWKIKRLVDFAVALAMAVVTLPITCAVLAVALFDVGMPVIFWQRHVGRDRAPLHLYKFRTLQTLFDPRTNERREARKPSVIGAFLQKNRLDELPQLWNILSGDMSLIGPRPLLLVDQPDDPSIRLAVRPGLSGWAQICGGKLISPEEKNALDEWYIRHASFRLDTAIVFRTVWMLLTDDQRDEKAIAMALAEKLAGELGRLSDSVAAKVKERRMGFMKRAEAMRLAEAAGAASPPPVLVGRRPTR
jgi:lipopolysaccharide/colanic/teichoic acid biosynthesis glycosyltransferase